MAKKQQKQRFSFQGFDTKHYRMTEQYAATIEALFNRATSEISSLAVKGAYNPDKPFSFKDYPNTNSEVKKIVDTLANNMKAVVETGSEKEWLHACKKNDAFLSSIMNTSKISKARLSKMQDKNLDALQTFQKRKVEGMNLSQRVWKYVRQYKEQIELGLDVGLGEGRSAQQLSRDLRQNLQDPDRLFRRVRDKRGNLQLSKAAKAFHPGQGVYRSSYKNAMRLTRSEVNMSYRESDFLRRQQLDFIVGFEVHRSNHNPVYKCKLCAKLVGKYPKDFKFKGWHPQCRCYMTPILMDDDDFDDNELSDLRSALYGEEYEKHVPKNAITDVPQGFKDWVAENEEKQAGWASTPYFIKDNFVNGNLADGMKYIAPSVDHKNSLDYAQNVVAGNPVKEVITPYEFNAKSLEKRGYDIYDEQKCEQSYKQNMDGFNIEEFDDALENILSQSGINILSKDIVVYSDELTIKYRGDDSFKLTRSFRKGVVEHVYLIIPDHLQGKGTSKEIFQALYKQYKNANINRIDVHANIDAGGYAWARYGFVAESSSYRDILTHARGQVRNGHIDQQHYDNFEKWIKQYKGKEIPMYEITSKPYAKELLKWSNWQGYIDLTNQQQREYFENYLYKKR